ncbi:MAG: penicillin-insensitive murein endopeptidase [Myxococcota bacterium]
MATPLGCSSSRSRRKPPPPTTDAGGGNRPPPPPPPTRRPPPPPQAVDCGNQQSFDSDGDGISDRVEDNNGNNNYADLKTGRCDNDPSRPGGRPASGRLTGGLNLPDRGIGYLHYLGTDAVDTDDWGALRTLSCLEAVGRILDGSGIRLGVGDLSLRRGGSFPPHTSHQNGLDIDMRYVRRDRRSVPLDLRIDPEDYDEPATKRVLTAFFQACAVDMIFVDIDRIGFTVEGQEERIIHVNGHSNHFHVRLRGP